MKFFSATLKDLRELYTNSLQKALDMEEQITKALPKMIEKASDTQLKQAFQSHLQETEDHVHEVRRILDQKQGEANTIKCKVLASLVSETEEMVADTSDPTVRDVALIAAAQQVEHHEMAVYGTLRTWAGLLGESADAQALEKVLEEEKHADVLLTGIAGRLNQNAEAPVTHAA